MAGRANSLREFGMVELGANFLRKFGTGAVSLNFRRKFVGFA